MKVRFENDFNTLVIQEKKNSNLLLVTACCAKPLMLHIKWRDYDQK